MIDGKMENSAGDIYVLVRVTAINNGCASLRGTEKIYERI